MKLEWVPGRYAICRLSSSETFPDWAVSSAGLLSITRTDAECSIVAPETVVPPDVRAERGWVALRVVGPLDFALIGILAKLTGALANAEVPVCALSTYDTDILLVRAEHAEAAAAALRTVATF